jgi:hypothetical protein
MPMVLLKDLQGKETMTLSIGDAQGENFKKFANAKKSEILALAGIGMQGAEDEVSKRVLNKIVQAMDDNLKKFGDDANKTAEFIGKKIAGSRPPYNNITGIIKKAKG